MAAADVLYEVMTLMVSFILMNIDKVHSDVLAGDERPSQHRC